MNASSAVTMVPLMQLTPFDQTGDCHQRIQNQSRGQIILIQSTITIDSRDESCCPT
eukprot:m.80491 g.80491  ORF g.80491 m.80491 type:complete len:56 (-) comp12604_c0_seq1:1833-2000(-)